MPNQNNIKNDLLGIETDLPFMEAESVTDEEDRERQKIARSRLFGFLVVVASILFGLVVWEFAEILNSFTA